MSWLVTHDRVLATLEVADTWRHRLRGVMGRDELDGALLLSPARGVHTFGVKFAIDVAYCDAEMVVLGVTSMEPNRLGMPRPRARSVIEAPKGSFERWGITTGVQLEVRL